MQGILYEETSVLYFAFVTLVMGGAIAWMTGRACALTWRPRTVLAFYILLIGVAVRFIHFAIFEGTLASLHYYLVDVACLLAIGFLGFQRTRTQQMVRQYYWIYEAKGPLSWKAKA